MSIVSKSVTRQGRLITLRYEFDDTTVREVKVRGDSASAANAFLLRHEPRVLASKVAEDADSALRNDSDAAQGDATQIQVYKAWMFKGFRASYPVNSYKYLSKVANKVLALGLTKAQLAAAFEEDVTTINAVLAKWHYVKVNRTAIQAYKLIKEGM